jgi:hypothetical protein
MVNVNEVFAQVSVGFFEIESTALTDGAMMPDTGFPDGNDPSGAFRVLHWQSHWSQGVDWNPTY